MGRFVLESGTLRPGTLVQWDASSDIHYSVPDTVPVVLFTFQFTRVLFIAKHMFPFLFFFADTTVRFFTKLKIKQKQKQVNKSIENYTI